MTRNSNFSAKLLLYKQPKGSYKTVFSYITGGNVEQVSDSRDVESFVKIRFTQGVDSYEADLAQQKTDIVVLQTLLH